MSLKKRNFIFLLVFILILLIGQKVFASNNEEKILKPVEYTDAFKNWLQLPEDERKKTMMPRMYEVETPSFVTKSPLLKASMLGTGIERTYNLKDVIPNNLIIKDQMSTYSCWAFATLSSLEKKK